MLRLRGEGPVKALRSAHSGRADRRPTERQVSDDEAPADQRGAAGMEDPPADQRSEQPR